MVHTTLVNGTAYEISGGRTLVNGTGYSIASGKTLVGGTAYEVGFGKPVTITITNTYDSTTTGTKRGGYVEYNGVQYTDDTSFVANIGDIITCRTYISQSGSGPDSYIKLNGVVVVSNDIDSTSNEAFYDYVVVADTDINLHHTFASYYGGGHSGTNIEITGIPDGQALVTITGNGNATGSYVVIDNITYIKENAVAVKIGTSIRCIAKYLGGTEDGYIQVNGNIVIAAGKVQQTLTYDYTVSKNATIQLVYIASASGATGRIIITEQ